MNTNKQTIRGFGQKILLYEDISVYFGNGSGDGKVYGSIRDVQKYVAQKLEAQKKTLLDELERSLPKGKLYSRDKVDFEQWQTDKEMNLTPFGAYRIGRSLTLKEVIESIKAIRGDL